MPASMISAETGCSAYVVGSSIAMVATGPMPGRTPISVPTIDPINAYNRLTGVSATPKPSAKWLNRSMARSVRAGPDRQLQLEADHENAHGQPGQQRAADQRLLGSKFVACRARQSDQRDGRNHQSRGIDHHAEQNDAAKHDQGGAPFDAWEWRALDAKRVQCQRGAEHEKHDAEDARKVTGAHARCGAERVIAPDRDCRDAEGDENQAGIKILGMTYERHCDSSRSRSL